MIDLGSFLAPHKSNIFLAMRGTAAPFKPPQTEGGTSPFWQPPDVSFGWDRAEKVLTFLNNISQTKTSVGGLNKAFFHNKKGWGEKGVKTRVYNVMG
jgi:hypothetical protein